ncbi:SusC/RagA family TonB-linked outer membrane protein [Adhaeribacter aerolatus]|uniref:SusC/RagA family TonB-linked outer membrane protein n=2 Tax=Adhaeribacter aerolatus TaxID=670289 RepID=A0A512AXJ9_9BACT|nr:SusC/RagA family TonB-linked outer membrane protein [Adhaeribacter aerolatus]
MTFCLLLTVATVMHAKPVRDITGRVTDEKGEGLPGVTILVKGTTVGTTTNAEGNFTIVPPDDAQTLIVSFVGFMSKEVAIGNASSLTIKLTADARALEEVVVVGYGEQKKAHLTGSVAQVNVADIEDLPVGSLATALSGRMAGVAVSGGTTRPGQAASIVVRNPLLYSKDGGTLDPLYVIDGVIRSLEDFNLLDASEVETISLLKDASAAIYGARAAQGVVLVKTKRGKEGKPKFNYSGSAGLSDATYMPQVMNGYEHANLLNTMTRTRRNFVADGPNGYLTDPNYYTDAELEHFRNNNYNWLEQAWKPSYTTRHALNVSGGGERATFFAGASYYQQDGNFDNINMNKWTFRANTDVKVTNSLKLGVSLAGDLSGTRKYNSKLNSSEEADMISLLKIPQWTPPYINGLPVSVASDKGYHFFEIQRLDNYKYARTTGLNINANLEYEVPFIKGLRARVQYSKNLDNKYSKEFATKYRVYNFRNNGHIYTDQLMTTGVGPFTTLNNGDRVFVNPDYTDNYQLNGFLNYNRQFGKHDVGALVLVEQAETYWEETRSMKEGIVEGGRDFMNMAFGAMDASTSAKESGNLSYVGRVNYNYAGKYLLEIAARYDASTKFAPEYRWGLFPSLSAGWVISEENFFKNNVPAINTLKLRGSVGLLGGDQAKPWLWRQRYTFNSNGAVFGGNGIRMPGLKLEAMPNPEVRWDDVTKINVGIDAGFLENRLSATLDGFHDHRYNMLYTRGASIPLTVGGTMPDENYATVNSFGYEISVGWKDNVGSDFNYYANSFLSWSDNKRILVDYAPGDVGTYLYPINQSTDQGIEGYHYLGMFRTQEDVDRFLETNPNYTIDGQAPKPGMLYYQDIRGPRDANGQFTAPDGKITEDEDKDWISPKASNHYGFGLSLGAGYKGLRLDMVLAGAFGGQALVEGNARKAASASENRPAFWADHWSENNTNAAYPNPFYDSNTWTSDFWFRNSFSFRMRSFNLSYALPKSFTRNTNARVFLNGTNPFNFFNPFDYKDPSTSFDAYPNVKTFNLGVNFTL